MAFNPDELPVVMAFRGKTMNGLTRRVIAADDVPTAWVRAKQLRADLDLSTTGFNRNRDQAISFGLIEPSDPDAKMPRYRIPDTDPVRLLRSFHDEYDPSRDDAVAAEIDSVVLPDLMELNGRAKLIGWFLGGADPDEQYSISQMGDVASVGHTTVRNHIQSLADYGIVTTDEAARGSMTYTVYQFNPDSSIVTMLYTLNEAIADHRADHFNNQ